MQEPDLLALEAGPENKRPSIKEISTMLVYEITEYFPAFLENVFGRDGFFPPDMFKCYKKDVWPVCIPAGFYGLKQDPGSSGTDSWGHSYIRLTSMKFTQCTLSDAKGKSGKIFTFREVFTLMLFIFWLIGREAFKNMYAKMIFLTSSLNDGQVVGVYVDEEGNVEVSHKVTELIDAGHQSVCMEEISSES